MSLIPCGYPRQDPQENLLLKSIMTCFEMQHTNMTPTSLQDKTRGRLSSHCSGTCRVGAEIACIHHHNKRNAPFFGYLCMQWNMQSGVQAACMCCCNKVNAYRYFSRCCGMRKSTSDRCIDMMAYVMKSCNSHEPKHMWQTKELFYSYFV